MKLEPRGWSMEMMIDIDDQVLIIWKRRKRKTKIGPRQRYM
jgi:hypothetical protein